MSEIVVRCVSCGAQTYPSPEAHTPGCYQAKITKLRKALGDLLGAHTKEELGAMLLQLHQMKHLAPDEASFNVSVQAIEVMLEIGS